MQVVDRLAVELYSLEVVAWVADKVFCQHAHTRAYLEQALRPAGQAVGYALGNALIGEEVLPQ